ncbi:MAG TPA: hypothetical protein VJ851_16760 [Jatrophihabitans sp.]|nr:hypothetical protein [Jatrophihabitans sp.]
MAFATVSRRAARIGRRRGSVAVADQLIADERSARPRRLASNRFFDAIVLISILMFLVLALGVAMLALQATGLSWP